MNERLEQFDELGIHVDFRKGKMINVNGSRFTGSFCEEDMTLEIATGKAVNNWFPVFIHECCHSDQWRENSPLWIAATRQEESKCPYNIVERETSKKNPDYKKLHKAVNIIRDLELDCEKRAIEEIKKYNLPFDIAKYIQGTNTYMYWHNMVIIMKRHHGNKWQGITDTKVKNHMPTELQEDYNMMPMEYIELFIKHGY
ncbi:MAG: hypothetical protein ACO2ZZ_14515 [Cyclobacteriaceae bacterium]|jgi:hypothetical protein